MRDRIDRTGLPEAAFTTLERHAIAYPDHNEDLNELLDDLKALLDSLPLCDSY